MTAQALYDATVRHAVYVERLKTGEVNQWAVFLKRIDRDLRERLTRDDITAFSRTRLEKLLVEIDQILKPIFDDYREQLSGNLLDLAEYEAAFEAKNLGATLQGFTAAEPTLKRLKAAIESTPLSVRGADGGKLLAPFIQDWTAVERKRITGTIRQAYFEGATNQEILQRVRGTRKNKFNDGILATTNRNADAIVRTSIQHVANNARAQTWLENSDIVSGYRWISVLDSRTTPICRTLDNQVYKVGKGPIPPAHIRCRSTTVAELGGEKFEKLVKQQTRASKFGQVKGDQNYYEWLKDQPKSFQVDVLGKTRAELFRNGGLSAERFRALQLDRNFKPLTLAEMRAREPLAFERAGI